jgi:hypothetical protein
MITARAAYRGCWAATWLAVSAMPIFFGLLVAPPVALFCLGALAAMVTAVLGWRQPTVWLTVGIAMATAAAETWWFGPAGLGVLVLAGATSPPAVSYVARRLRRPVVAVDGDPVDADHLSVLAQCLGDDRLCAAWSESYVALQLAHSPAERLGLVNLRQAYLDELEARNGPGFRTWLRSGARPVGNPRAFIAGHRPPDDD